MHSDSTLLMWAEYYIYFVILDFNCAGICCSCGEGAVRLAGDLRNESGPVELCHTGKWYKVCNNSNLWRTNVAQVLCRQLGYPTDGKISVFT